jgi:hypothetical protein
MNLAKNKWILLLLACAFAVGARAQNVYAQVNSKKVQVGVPFEYAVVISVGATNFTPPNLKDFDIVSGPNQSSSVQYVNGAMSQQIIISYALSAKKEGKYTIGPSIVMSGNQKLETNAIAIEVVKGSAAQGSGNPNEPAQGNAKISNGDLFIRTGTSKSKCYLGEQIIILQKVYSRYQIIGFQKFAQPTYDGFYSQAQESVSKGQLATENIDGVNYYTYELFRTVAIASKAGKINLTSIEGDVVIRRQTAAKPRNVFEQFFGATGYEDIPVTLRSKPMTVEVLDLPTDGRPENFDGAVGDFSFKVQATRNELKANEAFNLKMTISGKGNLKLVNAPKLNLPEGFETYDPKTTENATSKTFDYLIIPRNEGEYSLDNLGFSYFNLDTKKYVSVPAGEIKIKVLPADPNSPGAQVYAPHSQVKTTENDIRYIKKGDFLLLKSDTEFFNSSTHLALLLAIICTLGIVLLVRRKHISNNSNAVLVKERKAARLAKKQLVSARKLMELGKKDEFYTEILTALNNYLSHKLNIPVSDLSREHVNRTLMQKAIEPSIVAKLLTTLENAEYAKYAPGAVSGDLKTVYGDTVDLITGLEEQLNKKA